MFTVGVDTHRDVITAVILDEAGQVAQGWKGHNRETDWTELLVWVEEISADTARIWGVEGSGNQGRGLAQLLVAQGEIVCEINPRWTADTRHRSRRIDKSDQADALAIARLVQAQGDELPRVQLDDATTPLAILTRERESILLDVTRDRNRLHAELLRIDPAYKQQLPPLHKRAGLEAVLQWDVHQLGVAAQVGLTSAQRRVRRLLVMLDDLEAVDAELRELAAPVASPLMTLFGVAELTAGMLAGYLGPGRRFETDAQLAQYAGVAPLEASSASVIRHRLNRTGHRALNALIHRIALTQARGHHEAKEYIARRQAEGKSWREALRALKRYIVRAIFKLWNQCLDQLGYAK